MTRLEYRVKKFLEKNKDIKRIGNQYSCSRSPYKVKLPEEFTEDLCRFIGILHGDGNMSFSRIHISDKSLAYHEKVICQMFKKLFGLKLHIFEDKQRNSYYSHIKSKIVYRYLIEVLDVPEGAIREKLFLPNYIKELPNNLQASYVGGFFDAEGTIKKRQAQADFYTTNQEIFEFLKFFLCANSIEFSIYTRSRRKNIEYEIYIYGKERLMQLNKLIDIKHPDKIARLNMFSEH